MSTTKKIVSMALTATTLVWGSGALLLVPVASAQSTTDLQAQIAALLAQIQQLQAQLNSAQGGASVSYSFTRDLTVGSKGADVKALQQFLNANGAKVAASGAGSPGNETSFFGPATKAALAKYQAAHNVNPPAGYFGPKTRAYVASLAVAPATSKASGTPVSGTPVSGTTPLTGQVTISAGNNSNGGSIISGGAQIPVLNFTVANGTNQDVSFTGFRFTKTGVLSDSNISNAYLSLGGEIFAQYVGLSNGIISFSGNVLTVPAGQSKNVTLRVDISSGTSNGNTISFALLSASDTTLSSGTAQGSFPINGAIFTTTTVTNPSLASISSLSYQGVASQVDAGTLGFRASSLSYTVQNSPVKLMSIKYTISGSLNWQQDLQNAVLKLDGVQVAKGRVDPDGKVFFDASANPPVMNTGSHVLEVYVDVLGTANRLMTWQLLRPFEWVLIDTQYNQNLSGGTPSGTATQTSVRPGQSTVALSSGTPTGNIPLGSTSFVIAKFTYLASGEPVKIKWLPFKLTQTGAGFGTGASSTVVDSNVRNIAIYADDGTQLGTTINTPSSCTYGTPEQTATTYICAVGSPTSNINYIVPANTTRVFSLRVDVQAASTMTTIKGSLISPSQTAGFQGNNFEGQISFQTNSAPGGTIDGSVLTIVSNPFLASLNSALSNQTMVAGRSSARIASFSLGASSAEGINLTSVTLALSSSTDSSAGPLRVQNLRAQIGSTVLNYTVPSVSKTQTYTFSVPGGTTLIPAGGNVVIDVYGDVLQNSTGGTYTAPVSLTAAVGIGAITSTNQILKDTSNNAISSTNTVVGQSLTVGSSGALTILGVSNDPVVSEYTKGQTGVVVGKFQLRETTNNESVKIITLRITASSTNSTASASPWQNLTLVDASGNAIPGAGPLSMAVSGGLGTVNFAPSNMDIPANGTFVFGVKSDVSTDENFFQANNGTSWIWNIATSSDVVAVGDGSSASVTPTGAAAANASQTQTALGAKLSVSNFTKMPSVVINNSKDLKLGQVTFHTDGAAGNYAVLKQLNFTFSGPALTPAASTTATVYLRNPGDVVIATTSITFSSTGSSQLATLNLTTSTTDGYVYQGSDKTFTVSMDTNGLVTPSTGNQNPTVSLQIGSASVLTDVTFATYLKSPGFNESFNLDRLSPNSPLPKTVVVGYQ